jgi:ABC-type uncharacterized transport system ATPase subunit
MHMPPIVQFDQKKEPICWFQLEKDALTIAEIFTVNNQTKLVSLLSDVVIPAQQTQVVKGRYHGLAESFATQIVTIQHAECPTLIGGPGITQIDEDGRCTISLTNADPVDLAVGKGDEIR